MNVSKQKARPRAPLGSARPRLVVTDADGALPSSLRQRARGLANVRVLHAQGRLMAAPVGSWASLLYRQHPMNKR